MLRYLGISLDKLLLLEPLKGARILGGASGMDRRVTKVNVMEVPDIIDWVSDGEFLITAAYSIKDNIEILLELIPKLNRKGVAGLGIKVGRFIKELPGPVIRLADELGFPIIEIPLQSAHTDIISAVLTEVINDHMNMLVRIEAFNREVMDIMVKGGGLREIAGKLHEDIGNSLAIYGNTTDSFELVCNDGLDKGMVEREIYNRIGISRKKSEADENAFVPLIDDSRRKCPELVKIPIVIEKVEYGCVFIWQDIKLLTPFDNMLIESYVHIIALEFVKKLALYNMENNYKLVFFDDLLSDSKLRRNRALEKVRAFNFHKELRHTVIIILLKDLFLMDKFTYKKANFAKECISYLLFIVGRLARFYNEKVIYVEKNDRLLLLYESDSNKDAKAIRQEVLSFCGRIMDEMSKKFDKSHFTIGAGQSCEGVEQLWRSHDQARLIVESFNLKSSTGILHYDDLGLFRLLSHDRLQNELAEFYSSTLKPLADYDKANKSDLVNTLRNYFLCNGNMKKMSENMFMHYNTIIYRLQKIREISGIDIDDWDNRLNLEVALKVADLMQVWETG